MPGSAVSFRARVDRICTLRHVPTSESSDLPGLAEIAEARARTAQELSSLHPPSALKSGYRRLVFLISREAALFRQLAGYLRDGNDAAALATDRELRSNPVPRQARIVGLAKCA
jgi:hypothetical protein